MDNPVFRLEGVVKNRGEYDDFEGPLSLILQLLSKNKIEIRDVNISTLLDQYLGWMAEMEAMDLEVASEFVAMASHLVYIKARTLIADGEEPSELEELKATLENIKTRDAYERIKTVIEELRELYMSGGETYVKMPEPQGSAPYEYEHTAEELFNALLMTADKGGTPAAPASQTKLALPKQVYQVTRKTREIIGLLRTAGTINIYRLFAACTGRTEIVAALLSLLELCSAGVISMSGEGSELKATFTGELPESFEDRLSKEYGEDEHP